MLNCLESDEESSLDPRVIKVLGTLSPAPEVNKRFYPLSLFLTGVSKRKSAFFVLVIAFVALLGAVSTAGAQTVMPPGKPTGLTVTNTDTTSTKQFSLSWTAPTDNGGEDPTGYKIEWSTALFGTDFHPWFVLKENTMSETASYTHDHDIAPGINMQFRVSAINSAGTGTPSDSMTIKTKEDDMDTTPPEPQFDMTTVNGTRIEVKFTEDLNTAQIPKPAHLTVQFSGVLGTKRAKSIEIDTNDHSKLIITLNDSDAAERSDHVVIRYFYPKIEIGEVGKEIEIPVSKRALQDSNGNIVKPFDKGIRNVTPFCPKLVLTPQRIRENRTSRVTATLMPAADEELTLTVGAAPASPPDQTDPPYFELDATSFDLTIPADATESGGAVLITAGNNDEVGEADKEVRVSARVSKQASSMIEACSSVAPVTLTITDDDRQVRRPPPVIPDPPTVTPDPPTDEGTARDRGSLEALYNATGGDNWTRSMNWNTDEPLDTWYGVKTDSDGRITELILSDNGLEGRVPAELGDLKNLRRLYLDDNNLGGAIPLEELEALATGSALEELALWGNDQLTGLESVSAELGKRIDRAALRALYEDNGGPQWRERKNWLDPNEPFSFSDWDGVETNDDGRVSGIDLSDNGLNGDITNAIEALGGLETLDLSGNTDLSGELGLGLVYLSELGALDIQDTGVCAPADEALQQWLAGISFDGRNCVMDMETMDMETGTASAGGSGCSVVSDRWVANALADTVLNLLLIASALAAALLGSRLEAVRVRP